MKPFTFLAIAVTAAITLSACGTENSEGSKNNEQTAETASVEASEEKKEENESVEANTDTASEEEKAPEAATSSNKEPDSTEKESTESEEGSTPSADSSSHDTEETADKENSSDDAAEEKTADEEKSNTEDPAAAEESEDAVEASESTDAKTTSTSASEEEAVTEEVTVYYLDSDVMNTISETRSLEAPAENDLPFEAVQAWLDGPETEKAISPLPVETEVQFVEFKDTTAYVSFEPSVLEAKTVGSAMELAFVEQLAALMNQFGYDQTQILVDGEVVVDFYGHREIDQPIEAKDPSELYGRN